MSMGTILPPREVDNNNQDDHNNSEQSSQPDEAAHVKNNDWVQAIGHVESKPEPVNEIKNPAPIEN